MRSGSPTRQLWRAAITASIARLDELEIAHCGAGANRARARAPVILARNGMRLGFLQRSSVYWPTNHEASEEAAGIAVIRGHTAYQVPMHRKRAAGEPPGYSARNHNLGRTLPISAGSRRTSQHCASGRSSSSPRSIGDCTGMSSNT